MTEYQMLQAHQARAQRDATASRLGTEVRHAVRGLQSTLYQGLPPAPADITAARTALEALITLATHAPVPKTREEMAAFATAWDAKVDASRARHG